MDKDLKDAVLAAFDGKPEDRKGQAEDADAAKAEAVEAEEDGAGDQEGAADGAGSKVGAGKKKVVSGAGTTVRRAAAAGPAPLRRAGPGGETVAMAAARPKTSVTFAGDGGDEARPAARPHAVAAPAAPAAARSSAAALLSLVLTALLAVLVVALLVQVSGIRRDQKRLGERMDEQFTDVRNYSRIQFSTYAEQGKRPQQVVAVIEVKDGKPKIVNMVIRPLEEE